MISGVAVLARRTERLRCARACAATILALTVSLWTFWWGYAALREHAWEKRCVLVSGPWLPCGPHDWKGPLLMALVPLALLGLHTIARLLAAPFRAH